MSSNFQFLKIFQKIYDQLFFKKDNDVVTLTCKVLIEAPLNVIWNN